MARKSLAELLADAQLMAKALQGRSETLPVGVEAAVIEELNKLNQKAVELNTEQEKLKAQLKEKTAQLDIIVKNLEEKYAITKKYIKLGVPQELWREFGIEDKR